VYNGLDRVVSPSSSLIQDSRLLLLWVPTPKGWSLGQFNNSIVLRNLELCGNDFSFDHTTGNLTMDISTALNDKWQPLRPNHETNRVENARNRFLRLNFFGKDTFHAKNVSLGILTNCNAVLNKRGWVPSPQG